MGEEYLRRVSMPPWVERVIYERKGTSYAHLAKWLPVHVAVQRPLIPQALPFFIIPESTGFDACSGLPGFALEGRHEEGDNRRRRDTLEKTGKSC